VRASVTGFGMAFCIGMAGAFLVGWSVTECLLMGVSVLTVTKYGPRVAALTVSVMRGDLAIWEYDEVATLTDWVGSSMIVVGLSLSASLCVLRATHDGMTPHWMWLFCVVPTVIAGTVKYAICNTLSDHLRLEYQTWVNGVTEVFESSSVPTVGRSERVA